MKQAELIKSLKKAGAQQSKPVTVKEKQGGITVMTSTGRLNLGPAQRAEVNLNFVKGYYRSLGLEPTRN